MTDYKLLLDIAHQYIN